MTLVLRFAARSDVGRVRSKNDDSAYVGRHLAVLADGMGGHVGGDVASASTVLDLAPLDDVGYKDPGTVLPDEIQNANLILNELVHANPKLAGMGTTCTAALLAGETLHMAHIGDSRAYRLADGAFSQVTRDHTFVQKLVDEGRLEAAEAQFHPNKNVLMRVLGDVDASPELDVFDVPVAAGERWLLCSDGLTDVVTVERIHQELAEGEALNTVVDNLVDLTLKGGAPDNVTIVVFEVAEGTPEELAPPPEVHLSEDALAVAQAPEAGAVSGRLLREDLAARPHLIVGAAASAVKTDRIPVVTRSSTRRRAAALLGETPAPENRPRRTAALLTSGGESVTPAPLDSADGPSDRPGTPGEAEAASASDTAAASAVGTPEGSATAQSPADGADGDSRRRRDGKPTQYRRGWFIPVFTTLLALLLAAVALWGYLWTQTQYYVGEDAGQVAVYRGVPQHLGPLDLSHVDRRTDLSVDGLPSYAQERVRSGMAARDLGHAEQIVTELSESLAPGAPAPTGETSEGGER